jgi:serine/threonine protein kinase
MEGQRIGSYRVVRKIGQGGMGAVYEAVHEQLGRRAAIKLLRKELSQDPQIVIRFFNEGKAASRIEHSGIVQIFEYGHLPDQTAYIIMEFLRGEALSARLRSLGGKLPLADLLRISRQIASALAATHAKGIIHRDLKPDNIMLVPDSEMPGGERVKILDFGVAKVPDNSPGAPAVPASSLAPRRIWRPSSAKVPAR